MAVDPTVAKKSFAENPTMHQSQSVPKAESKRKVCLFALMAH